jgi:hypothetical protein
MLKSSIKTLIITICLQFPIHAQNTTIYTGGDTAKLTGIIYKSSEKEGDGKVTHYTWLHLDSPITLRKNPLDAVPEDTEPIVADITKLWIGGKDIQKFKQGDRIEAEGELYLWRGGGAPCMAIKSARLVVVNDNVSDHDFDNIPTLFSNFRPTDVLQFEIADPRYNNTSQCVFNAEKTAITIMVQCISKHNGGSYLNTYNINIANVKIEPDRAEVPNESSEKSHALLGFAGNPGAWVLTTGPG